MKKILFSIVALCCTMAAGAQNSSQQLTAILQPSEGDPTVFYGIDALKNACNAAEDGSVITLTSGLFNPPGDIKKSISIYGAGFEDGITEGVKRTNVNGLIRLYAEEEGSSLQSPRLEGLFVNGNIEVKQVTGLTVAKCQFGGFAVIGTDVESTLVRQCYLTGSVNGGNYLIKGLTVKNSYIARINGGFIANGENHVLFDHCLLAGSEWRQNHGAATYTNNMITNDYSNDGIVSGAYSQNNIYSRGSIHEGVISENDWFGVNFSTLFSDGVSNANYGAERTFTLTEENKTKYKGTDGTEVGITGGEYPWYKVPSTPYVKDLNATVSGTDLNVTYEAGVRSTNPPTE